MYLVNESSKLESVNRVHEIGEKSHSLLDHPRIKINDPRNILKQSYPWRIMQFEYVILMSQF